MYIHDGPSIDRVIYKYLSRYASVYTISKKSGNITINSSDEVDVEKLRNFINKHRITHFFYSENSSYLPLFLRDIPSSVSKVMFLIDTHINLKRRLPYVYLFDHILLVNAQDKNKLKRINPRVSVVTYGADTEVFKKLPGHKKKYDVTFDGNIIPWIHYHRFFMLLYLKMHGIFINHTKATYNDLNPVFNQSKILINRSPLGGWNMRLFEALSAGVFLLTDGSNLDIQKTFINKKHLVYYFSLSDLVNKISYYLHNDNERELIAKQGNRYVRKYYSWSQQVKKMIVLMNKYKGSRNRRDKKYYTYYHFLQCYSFRDMRLAFASLNKAFQENEISYVQYVAYLIRGKTYYYTSMYAISLLNFFRKHIINRIYQY